MEVLEGEPEGKLLSRSCPSGAFHWKGSTIMAGFASRDITGFLSALKHKFKLWRIGRSADTDYREYLNVQFNRTFSKRNQIPDRRIAVVMEKLVELGRPAADAPVLCVGPRDGFELEWFRTSGFTNVIGIDIFSQAPGILVMDMHSMTFPDDSFEVVYSSHSLEHSYDVDRVVREFVRVAKPGALMGIEVPIKFTPRGADRFDFGGVDGLHKLFESCIDKVIWSDEQPPKSAMNASGTAVARTIFSVRKAGTRGND
jgi:SAM-dependent methyltransferase